MKNTRQFASPPPAVWDEQIGLTFSQDFPSLNYNVTVIPQSDTNGYGPAYLLNGLTDRGYWYQIGLTWNWPLSAGGYNSGFALAFEVFNSTGSSIYPKNGQGGLMNYSGTVNPGDNVLLGLRFLSGQVQMYSKDWNTSAIATQNYTAMGGALFVGLSTSSNSKGFFSGLMTEQYHAAPYVGSEAKVTYSNPQLGINAATMWADEWNPVTNQTLFSLSSPQISYSNPNQFQYFYLNGTVQESNAYYYITGSYSLVGITLSYSVSGGGTNFAGPTLNYMSEGSNQTAILTATPTTYFMDGGSVWSATNPLGGSSGTQRWIAAISSGNVTSSTKINLVYVHQYDAVFNVSPSGSGTIQPSGTSWIPANTPISVTASGIPPFLFVKWVANTSNISFTNSLKANTTLVISGPGAISANFALVAVTLSSASGSVTQGSQISTIATVSGPNGSVSLSITGLPSGASVAWNKNPLLINKNGVQDELNISTSYSTAPGTYQLTINALSTNGSNSIVYALTINKAVPLTVSYSLSDGSASQTPTINYTYNGMQLSAKLSQTQASIYMDSGSTWKITRILGGATSERWITNSSSQGTATSPVTVSFLYVHQYAVNFQFKAVNGGNVPIPPVVSVVSLGIGSTVAANGSQIWVDAISTFSFSQLISKSSTERWELSSNRSGVISKSVIENSTYVHQVLVNASYEVMGSGLGSISPKLSYQSLGKNMSAVLTVNQTALWMDSGTKWSVPSSLNGSSFGERWMNANSNSSGVVGIQSPLVRYETQYFVTVGLNSPSAGTVPSVQGWYNASLPVSLFAKANNGWKFAMWLTNGHGTSNSNSTSILIMGPTNETAVFDAGLVISSESNGQIDYNYGNVSGTVSGGASSTVYVPLGTSVTLNATPSSLFYSAGGWSNNGSSSSTSMIVSKPTTISASFSFNAIPLTIIAVVLTAIIVLAAVIIARKRGSGQFLDTTGHGWKW